MARRRLAVAVAAMLVLPLITVVGQGPAISAGQAAAPGAQRQVDTRPLTRKDFTFNGKKVETATQYQPQGSRAAVAGVTPPVGTVRPLLALDDFNGIIYLKNYTLRGVGEKVEVWVANDTSFPAGDCRLAIPDTTTVTDAQVASLVDEFDNNMFPLETNAFSTPPDRDGTNALIPFDFTGAGDKTVALIDNVRDDNFFDFPAAPTYIAGFFFSLFNEFMDRNVMTIDAFDWAHRTGANPPNEPTGDLCTSRPGRPFLYEGVFAHEWQHLLMYYTDPFETTWVNEGLSDFAQTLTGYVDGTKQIDEFGFDSHITCFQGWGTVATPANTNPRDCGGPENSLNLWDEGGIGAAVLADYGHTYSLMLMLFDRYGADFMSRLHQDSDLQGLASLDAALEDEGVSNMYRLIHDFQTMNVVDKAIGDSALGFIFGVPKSRVTTASLRASLNLANPRSYAQPGAGPNGADYVLLRKSNGQTLKGIDLRSLRFQGAATLPAEPLLWTLDNTDPDRPGNSVLFSGNMSNLDAGAVASVAVPNADPTLRFLSKYGAEAGFDYGYVMVSTDGGANYTIIPGDKTVDAPLGPGINGTTVGFEAHSYDMSAYAGQNVLLGFRYVSDGSVNEGGWKIDDITVGATSVSDGSSLAPFDSPSEISPTPVNNWNLRLIGLDENNRLAWQLEFNAQNNLSLNILQLAPMLIFPKVVAVVAYDEPTEQVGQYAPYTLRINGVLQPGGQ